MAKSCKYYKQQRQVSYDNGVTWIPLDEYQKGALIEVNSSDCTSPSPKIYRWTQTEDTVCVFDGKFMAKYNNGQTYEIPCDGNPTLTSGDTHPQGYDYSAMTEAYIGSCVTSFGRYAFRDCSGLTSVTIPNSVTSIGGGAFLSCISLTSIDIPNTVTSIEASAFWNCSSLVSVNIPNDLARIEMDTFYLCRSLVSVTIPSSVTFIGNSAFYNCINLQSVTCLGITPPSTQLSFFEGSTCPIYVPSQSVNAYKTTDYWWIYASRIQAIP